MSISLRKKIAGVVLMSMIMDTSAMPIQVFAATLAFEDTANANTYKRAKVSRFNEYYSDKRQAYDAVFKMDNENIETITTTGAALKIDVGTENIVDEDLDTYWEAEIEESTSLENALIFTLKEETVLNRIAYKSAGDTVGFVEEFEIWASNTTEGDTFQLVSSGEATKTSDVVEIKFDPTSFKRIKFVFKNDEIVTASEMMFYKEDEVLDQVKTLFTDDTMSTVSEAFNTVDKIDVLEEAFKSHPLYEDYEESFEKARALIGQSTIEQVEVIEWAEAEVSRFDVYYSNKRQAYDDAFKMDRSNIESITSAGGNRAASVGTGNIVDGSLDTYWETGRHTSDSFNNELVFTLEEETVLNRIAYRSAWNTVGFAEEFEIWASSTAEGDTFELVSSATATKTADVIEIKFNPTSFKRIKFVFKNNGTATASEMMFYKEDEVLDQVKTLFTDSTMSAVSEAFNTVDKINALEDAFKAHPLYEDYKENFENARALIGQSVIEWAAAEVSRFDAYYSNKRQAYDTVFRMDNSNIESITSAGGALRATVGTNNIIDGSLDTYWETGRHTSESFNNELIFTLKEEAVLNRIAYRSAWNTVGFAEEFEIWASSTTMGDTFQLVSTGKATKTADMVEIKFNPTSFRRIKFVFKNVGTATASEMMFYQEDEVKDKIDRLFTTVGMDTVSEEFNSIDKITALEEEAKNHPLYALFAEALQEAKGIVSGQLKNVKTVVAEQHGNMAAYSSQVLKIGFANNYQPTGVVALPGETITVYVDVEEGKPVPQLMFSQQEGSWSSWGKTVQLKAGKNVITVPRINFDSNYKLDVTPGGPVYIVNPYTEEEQGKAPVIRFAEGVQAFPMFDKNTNEEEFIEFLKEYKAKLDADVEENPNVADRKMIDTFEVVADHVFITGTASGAYEAYVNQNFTPSQTVQKYNDHMELLFKYQGLDGSSEKNDPKYIRENIRLAQPWAAMYAATGHIGIQRDLMVSVLTNVGGWGIDHEIGHKMDIGVRTIGEVTNNMLPQFTSYYYNATNKRIKFEDMYSSLVASDKNYLDFGVFEKLGVFWQLEMIYPGYWAELNKYYRENNITTSDMNDKLDKLAYYSSKVLELDLTEHFERYGFPVSEATKAFASNYEKPDKKIWYANYDYIEYEGEGFTSDPNLQVSTSREGENIKVTFNVDEDHKNDVMGYEIYRDEKLIGFTSTNNSYVDTEISYNDHVTYKVVPFDKKLNPGQGAEVSSYKPAMTVQQDTLTLKLRETFNPMDLVKAQNYKGEDITSSVEFESNVDTSKKGNYQITYRVTDEGMTVEEVIKVTVVSEYDYLSDIEWSSASTEYGSVRKDNDLKLFVNGEVKNFNKGIGLHANGELVYDLSGKDYDKFEAFIGVSRSIPEQNNSSIIFKILADGEEIYNSGLMKYATPAQFVSLDIQGVKELKIVIDDSGNNISSDHAVIGHPILTLNNVKPTLEVGNDESIELRSDYDLMASVYANDVEDGDITEAVVVNSNGFTTDKGGEYTIAYSVTDSDNNTTHAQKKVLVYSEVAYLSDLNWTSARTDYGLVRKDKASENVNIKLLVNGEVKEFTKGIGTHANSEIVYNLEGKDYKYFETYVGVDRNIPEQNNSSVIFKIYADGVEVYNSGLMKYNTEAKFVRIPVDGVKELKLVADNAGNGNASDHADFADAKFLITNSKPELTIPESVYIALNSEFDPMTGVAATDKEDGDMTSQIVVNDGGFNNKKTGQYRILYSVTDSDGNTTTKERDVLVYSKSEYLSNMEWESAVSGWKTVKKDAAVNTNSKIKLNVNGVVKEFDKGFGAATNAEIVYDLNGEYNLFTTYLGTDKNYNVNATTILFKIFADGEEVYSSDVIRVNSEAEFVKLDVTGVKELKLVANDAGDSGYGDFASWADTKVYSTNAKPELTIPQSMSTTLGHPIDLSQAYSAIDAEDGDLTDQVKVEGTVNFDKTGEYPITYTVTDSDGNEVVKTRTIAVVDMNDFTYLTEYAWKSETHSYAAPKIDLGHNGGAIRLTDQEGKAVSYPRGLGAHSNSTVVYDLSDKNYDYFTSYVGVDRSSYNTIGSVTFEVYVDGVKKFDSGLMRSTDAQKFVQVDINGAKELKLVVTDGGNGNGNDHASWGNTKLHYANENGSSIDKTALDALIKVVNELNSKLYTEESFNHLKVVLEDVNTQLADGYTQEEINTLYTKLKEAYEALVKATDFSELEEVIANNSNYNELHYFRDAMTAHKAVIEEARAVLANKEATQEEIDAATAKVMESAKTLIVRENKVELEQKINRAKTIENNNYNAIRWDNFCYAIQYAQEIYENIDASDEEIRAALFMLQYCEEELK